MGAAQSVDFGKISTNSPPLEFEFDKKRKKWRPKISLNKTRELREVKGTKKIRLESLKQFITSQLGSQAFDNFYAPDINYLEVPW